VLILPKDFEYFCCAGRGFSAGVGAVRFVPIVVGAPATARVELNSRSTVSASFENIAAADGSPPVGFTLFTAGTALWSSSATPFPTPSATSVSASSSDDE